MRDVCSRLEDIPDSVWDVPGVRPALWATELLDKIASDAGVLFMRPALRIVQLQCPTNFSGRWFFMRNGIAISAESERPLFRGLIVHESCHWRRWVFGGDEPGMHDAFFYRLAEDMYPRYGVSLDIAKRIEKSPPKHWLEKESW